MKIDRMLYLAVIIAYVWPVASLAQDRAKAPPPTVQELSERITALEADLKAAEQRADRTALDTEYTQRIQKQYESYYEKAFNTQIWILTIFILILTVLLGFTARFGLTIFDRQIDNALRETSTQLRSDFTRALEKEMNALSEASTKQTSALEVKFAELVKEQEKDLKILSRFNFQFSQGLAFALASRHTDAVHHFHNALESYVRGKARGLFPDNKQVGFVANIFRNVWRQHEQDGEEESKKAIDSELRSGRYAGLVTELESAAAKLPPLADLLKGVSLDASTLGTPPESTAN